jgi:hypothetical protein
VASLDEPQEPTAAAMMVRRSFLSISAAGARFVLRRIPTKIESLDIELIAFANPWRSLIGNE